MARADEIRAELLRRELRRRQQKTAAPDVPIIGADGRVSFPAEYQNPQFSMKDRAIGAGEAALSLATGATGGAVGMVGGSLYGLGREMMGGNFGTPGAADRIERQAMDTAGAMTYAPRTQAGQRYAQEVGEQAARLVPLAGLPGEMAALAGGLRAAGATTPSGTALVRDQARRAGDQAAMLTGQPPRQLPPPQRGRMGQIARTLNDDPFNDAGGANRLLGGRAFSDALGQEAIKQGFKPGVIAAIKASSPEDRRSMRQMVDVLKRGRENERYRAANRPADVLGHSVVRRIDHLFETKRQAGKELDVAAEALRGRRVDIQPAIDSFIERLNQAGVRLKMQGRKIVADLSDSDMQGDRQSQRLLNTVLERLSDTQAPDGYRVHTAKRFLDTQVDFRKKGQNGLANRTEAIVKGLRHDLNESLRAISDDYRLANDKFSETLTALDDYQRAAGTSINLEGPNANKALGQASRKLVTNYTSRVNMIDALERVNETAKKYGMRVDDDIMSQLIFANELDRMFGAPGTGTFKGQIEEALRTGVQKANQSMTENAVDAIGAAARKARGITDDNALSAIERLLDRELRGQ